MKTKTLTSLFTAFLIGTAALAPLQASAQVNINVNIGAEPPPPRYERVPSPRKGYIWAPGYWNWNGHRHVWTDGHWERARSGYAYQNASWYQDGHGWHLNKGHWKKQKHGKKDKHDSRHLDDRHGHGYHCPPGQAKKGNC